MKRPVFWLVAGPNGSGKSTFADSDVFDRLSSTPEAREQLLRFNADAVARELTSAHPELEEGEINLKAVQYVDGKVDAAIEAQASFLVETVLSSDKYESRVLRAKQLGYSIVLTYVLLRDPELNVARVAQRVAQGGHSVAAEKIRARWASSLQRLPRFARLADAVTVWDNSSAAAPAKLLIEATPAGVYFSQLAVRLAGARSSPEPLRDALSTVISDLGG